MKKLLSFAIAALLFIPVTTFAAVVLESDPATSDGNGLMTAKVYFKVDETDTIAESKTITFTASHSIIKSIDGAEKWTKEDGSNVLPDGTSATLVVKYAEDNGLYIGNGERIQIGTITYVHDDTYKGSEPCKVSMAFEGSSYKDVEEKVTPNAKTGSVLPYVGIIGGVALIATAYVVSKKSNKLYKI